MLILRGRWLTLLTVFAVLHQPSSAFIQQDLLVSFVRTFNSFKQCGLQKGGNDVTEEGKWPWMAYLYYPELGREDGFFCGGTLIDTEWILTAAHCIKSPNQPWKYRIILGERNIGDMSGHEKDFGVTKIIRHRYFRETTFENDVALIKLSKPVLFSDYIRPPCLPENGFDTDANSASTSFAGKNCTVLGWGEMENKIKSQILQSANMTVMPRILCNSETTSPGYLSPVLKSSPQFCAFGRDGQDTCKGDSGGPLLCKHDNKYYLHGVTSYGTATRCGEKNPTIYGQVSKFREWISLHILQG